MRKVIPFLLVALFCGSVGLLQAGKAFGLEPTMGSYGPTSKYLLIKVPYKYRDAVRLLWHGTQQSHGYGVYEPGSWLKFSNYSVSFENHQGIIQEHPVKFQVWVRDGVLFLNPLASNEEPQNLSRRLSTSGGQKGSYSIIPHLPFMIVAPEAEFSVVSKTANYAIFGAPKPIEGETLEYEVVGPLEVQIIYDAPARGEACESAADEGASLPR